jgi:hypothetical protein
MKLTNKKLNCSGVAATMFAENPVDQLSLNVFWIVVKCSRNLVDVAEQTLDGAELLVDEKPLEKLNSRWMELNRR